MTRIKSIIILNTSGYILKFLIYKYWVFKNDFVNLKRYLIHTIPIFFILILTTQLTIFINEIKYVAILISLISGLTGYLWGRVIYKKF